ncbi:hypothetical protein ACFVT1_17320 [Streptomyces sp. NPDC057963]
MADRYPHFTGTAPGRFPARRPGLPQPASAAVNGQIVRVCGQNLLGA